MPKYFNFKDLSMKQINNLRKIVRLTIQECKKEFEKERKEDIKLFNEAFETWVKTHPKWSEGVRERASKILTGILTRQFENKIRKQERQRLLDELIKELSKEECFGLLDGKDQLIILALFEKVFGIDLLKEFRKIGVNYG